MSNRHRRIRATGGIIAASVLVVASLGLAYLESRSDASAQSIQGSPLSATDAVSPLRDMMGAGGPFGSIAYAEFVNSRRAACLRDRGWNEVEPPVGFEQIETHTTVEGMRAFAAKVGYGLQTQLLSDEAIAHRKAMDAQSAAIAKLDEASRSVYASDSDQCMTMAESLAASTFPSHDSEMARRMATALAAIESSPEMVSAKAEWSACMADRGYDVATSVDARRDFSDRMFSGSIDEASVRREIATASTDVECSITTVWRVGRPLEITALEELGLPTT